VTILTPHKADLQKEENSPQQEDFDFENLLDKTSHSNKF
jgi:hypothetical protein